MQTPQTAVYRYSHSFFMIRSSLLSLFFFFNDTATTEIYTLSLHDALPIFHVFGQVHDVPDGVGNVLGRQRPEPLVHRSEEHTSELQSLRHLVCRLLLEKKKNTNQDRVRRTKARRHRCR